MYLSSVRNKIGFCGLALPLASGRTKTTVALIWHCWHWVALLALGRTKTSVGIGSDLLLALSGIGCVWHWLALGRGIGSDQDNWVVALGRTKTTVALGHNCGIGDHGIGSDQDNWPNWHWEIGIVGIGFGIGSDQDNWGLALWHWVGPRQLANII